MKRILIVDDAATVRLYHRKILEAEGFQVEEAVNGLEALEKALQSPFDLYLVDVNMPRMAGYEFLVELRRQAVSQAPAIMISTEAAAGDRRRALEAGANLYMVKPTRQPELALNARLMLGELFP